MVIKPPKTSGLPFESLQVRSRVTDTKINCEQSRKEQELLFQMAKAFICIYLWLSFRGKGY